MHGLASDSEFLPDGIIGLKLLLQVDQFDFADSDHDASVVSVMFSKGDKLKIQRKRGDIKYHIEFAHLGSSHEFLSFQGGIAAVLIQVFTDKNRNQGVG
jgi:hypothetical protein